MLKVGVFPFPVTHTHTQSKETNRRAREAEPGRGFHRAYGLISSPTRCPAPGLPLTCRGLSRSLCPKALHSSSSFRWGPCWGPRAWHRAGVGIGGNRIDGLSGRQLDEWMKLGAQRAGRAHAPQPARALRAHIPAGLPRRAWQLGSEGKM